MTIEERKALIAHYKSEIQALENKIEELNPYGNLKKLSNKAFGEGWSEPYILSRCPSFTRVDGKGFDFTCERFGKVEVKSSRLPCAQITFNQCHLFEADFFLFVEYDTENITENIFFVPSQDLLEPELFSKSIQHNRIDEGCYTISGSSAKNQKSLEKYRIASFEALEEILQGGKYGED